MIAFILLKQPGFFMYAILNLSLQITFNKKMKLFYMSKKLALVIIVYLTMPFCIQGQNSTQWDHLKFFIGKWIGQTTEGDTAIPRNSLFTSELDDNIIVRKNYLDFGDKPGGEQLMHEDLMIIFRYPDGGINATYFDNENRIINFVVSISESGEEVIFQSIPIKGMPFYKITYIKINKDEIYVNFESSTSGNKNDLASLYDLNMLRMK